MPRKRPPAAKNQLPLPISRKQRFGSLRKIDPAKLGIGLRQWGRVVDLLEQVELCGQRDGCFAYADTLAARMDGLVGVSKPTLHRARRVAEQHGLLVVSRRHDGRRQQSSEWSVAWDRVMILAGGEYESETDNESNHDQSVSSSDQGVSQTQATEPASFYSQTDTPPCQTDTPGCQTDTLYKGTASTPISSSLGSTRGRDPDRNPNGLAVPSGSSTVVRGTGRDVGRPDVFEKSQKIRTSIPRRIGPPLDPDRVEHQMRKIGKPRSRRDCEYVWKLVAISEQLLGENWLEEAIAGVQYEKRRNPYGYLTQLISESTAQVFGDRANETPTISVLLARTKPPPESWRPFAPGKPDMSERACTPLDLGEYS